MIDKINNLKMFFKTVFGNINYITIAVITALLFVVSSIWLANYNFLYHTFVSDLLSLDYKIKIVFNFVELIKTSVVISTLITISIISILFGINIAALIFYIKKQISISKGIKASGWASLVSLLGVGCFSCGSVIISSIFGFSATAAFLGFLPFHGYEFGVIGIISLLISIYLLAKKINNNFACKV